MNRTVELVVDLVVAVVLIAGGVLIVIDLAGIIGIWAIPLGLALMGAGLWLNGRPGS